MMRGTAEIEMPVVALAAGRGRCLRCAVVALVMLLAGCGPGRRAVPIDDPETQRLVAAANAALEEGAFDAALALADSASARAPDAVEPLFLKGLIFSRTLRWDKADRAYRAVIDLDPEYPGVWNNLGNNAVWQGEYQDALGHFFHEIEIEPAPLPWAAIGRVYRELGAVDSAAYAFEQAIALDSSHIPAHLSYAALLDDEGRYAEALDLTEQAARRAPDAIEVKYMLGSLLAELDRTAEAIGYLQEVAQAWPWHTESHYRLGRALQRAGRVEESRQILAQAEELWKRQADVTAYQRGVTTDPDNPYAHAALATAFRMAGRYDEAIRTYQVALALDADNPEFLNNLASLHFLKHDTLAAIRTYHQILSNHPEMVEVWKNLGVLYALMDQDVNARRAWTRGLAVRPDDQEILTYLAKLDSSD